MILASWFIIPYASANSLWLLLMQNTYIQGAYIKQHSVVTVAAAAVVKLVHSIGIPADTIQAWQKVPGNGKG